MNALIHWIYIESCASLQISRLAVLAVQLELIAVDDLRGTYHVVACGWPWSSNSPSCKVLVLGLQELALASPGALKLLHSWHSFNQHTDPHHATMHAGSVAWAT